MTGDTCGERHRWEDRHLRAASLEKFPAKEFPCMRTVRMHVPQNVRGFPA